MKYEQFRTYMLVLTLILAALVAVFVVAGNYIIPLLAIIVAIGIKITLKKKVKGVISDERIEGIAGKAAQLTYVLSIFAVTILSLTLIALRKQFPLLEPVAYSLAYVACGIMLLYTAAFKYYNRA
jgi:uncharacterized membrane protein